MSQVVISQPAPHQSSAILGFAEISEPPAKVMSPVYIPDENVATPSHKDQFVPVQVQPIQSMQQVVRVVPVQELVPVQVQPVQIQTLPHPVRVVTKSGVQTMY